MSDPELNDLLARAGSDPAALEEIARKTTTPEGRAALNAAGQAAAEPLAALVLTKKGKALAAASEALADVARHVDGARIEAAVLQLLSDLRRAIAIEHGLKIVARSRKPAPSWVEPCADASAFPGAADALKRFPYASIQRELRSMLSSRSTEEQCTGLELLLHHGKEAAEFVPQVQAALVRPSAPRSTRLALEALIALMPADELPAALEPALDHYDPMVRAAARAHLSQLGAPVRDSAWEGHPFSQELLAQLQRLGFRPKQFPVPAQRGLPALPYHEDFGERRPEDETATIGAAVWALYEGNGAMVWPSYALYTVWGSYENSYTFYFGGDGGHEHIFPVELDGKRRLMFVLGDGSIGYYAALDLLDGSPDPTLFYMERWGAWHAGDLRPVAHNLSRYLARLGVR